MRQIGEGGWEEPGSVSAMQVALARCDWSPGQPVRLRPWLGAQLTAELSYEPDDEAPAGGDPEDWDL